MNYFKDRTWDWWLALTLVSCIAILFFVAAIFYAWSFTWRFLLTLGILTGGYACFCKITTNKWPRWK